MRDITLISVTQKIDPVKDYDQIIVLMEGELIAKGKHEYLMQNSPEYVQIYQSQKSTTDLTVHKYTDQLLKKMDYNLNKEHKTSTRAAIKKMLQFMKGEKRNLILLLR